MHKFFDFEIAYFLYKISRILAVFEDNKYKSEAYFKAAMAIDAYDTYVFDSLYRNELPKIMGVGSSSEKIVREIIETGRCSLLVSLEQKYHIDDYSLILTSGLNNKLIKKLFECGIRKFEQLLARRAQLVEVGFSKKEMDQLQIFIEKYTQVYGQYLFSYAYCLSNELVEYLNNGQSHSIAQRDLVWSNKVKFAKIVCLNNRKDEIVNLINQSERYCKVEICKEKIFCSSIFGLPFELELVDKLPQQSGSSALRGDLHMHTTWSDGVHNISQMVARAKELGREYIGITDHSFSLRVANGLSEVDAVQQIEEIHRLRDSGIKILAGIEVEILKDGSLDFSDSILSQFDYVIAGIHTFLNQKHNELKQRIETALKNPYVSIFAHPSSRILGRPGVLFSERDSYCVEIDEIIDICSQNDVAVEFNCFPERFDVDVQYFNIILNKGLAISVGSDSHSAAHLNCIQYAEEALINFPEIESNILNYMGFEQVRTYFNQQRARKTGRAIIEINKDVKNFNYFFKNNNDIVNGDVVSIGIDLTGSESKPSGWAALIGNEARTAMICADNDLIEYSMSFHPRVISIDSPLSHPYKDIGITRYCERVLSSYGIHAYPCLIPSMVNLTNRGMRLADKFRQLGVEVIESYPGAAQDILSIRRKQNGLMHLKNGYKSFGISGDYFDSETIKHDELDAIMSALVGYFYLNNQYVALGNDQENYLIVPSIAKKYNPPIIIGLAGDIAVGKTTIAEYMKFKHGFKTLRYSEIIKEHYGCSDDRATLQEIGAKIAADNQAQKNLSLEIIKLIDNDGINSYIIDGLRHRIDFDTLKEHFKSRFVFIYIDSSFTQRYRRYSKRLGSQISRDEFMNICNNEAEKEIFLLRFLANKIVKNDTSFKDLFNEIEIQFKELICQ